MDLSLSSSSPTVLSVQLVSRIWLNKSVNGSVRCKTGKRSTVRINVLRRYDRTAPPADTEAPFVNCVIRGSSHYDTDINVDTTFVHGEPSRTVRQSSSLARITAVAAAAADIASDADQVDCEITYSLSSNAGDRGFHAAVSQAQQPAATFLIHDLTD